MFTRSVWKSVLFTIFFIFCISFAGCRHKLTPGLYEGGRYTAPGWELPGQEEDDDPSALLALNIEYDKAKKTGKAVIKNSKGEILSTIDILKLSRSKVKLIIPFLTQLEPIELERTKKQVSESYHKCYTGKVKAEKNDKHRSFQITMCFAGDEFRITVNDSQSDERLYQFYAGRVERENEFEPEVPAQYEFSELIDRIKSKNFGSRLEYIRLMQANQRHNLAITNLFPHFRIFTAITLTAFFPQPSPVGFLNGATDAIPFLFPTRLLTVVQTKYEARSAAYGYNILRGNLLLKAYATLFGYLNHQSILETYDSLIMRTSALLETIKHDPNPKYDRKYISTVESVVEQLKFGKGGMNSLINQGDLPALAAVAGFKSPIAIKSIYFRPRYEENRFPPLGRDETWGSKLLPNYVIARSLELRQFNASISAVKKAKHALPFSWFDPNTANMAPLGLNLIPQWKIANLDIKALELQALAAEQTLTHQAITSVLTYNSMAGAYNASVKFKDKQEERLEFAFEHPELHTGQEIQAILKDYVEISVMSENYLTNFRLAQAQIKRLLWLGEFGEIATNLDPIDTKKLKVPLDQAEFLASPIAEGSHDHHQTHHEEHFNHIIRENQDIYRQICKDNPNI